MSLDFAFFLNPTVIKIHPAWLALAATAKSNSARRQQIDEIMKLIK